MGAEHAHTCCRTRAQLIANAWDRGCGPGVETRRVRLVQGERRGVSGQYGGRDAACPISTGGGTRRVRLVRGEEGGARVRSSSRRPPRRALHKMAPRIRGVHGGGTCRGEHGAGEAPLAAGSCWKAVLSSHLRGGRAAGRLRLQSGEREGEGLRRTPGPPKAST
jgi:hypothetical protein